MKALIAGVSIVTVVLLIGIYFLPIPGVLDIPSAKGQELYAGEGEICSTPAYNIDCQEGLICATRDGRSEFEIREETGICFNISDIVSN